MASDFTPAIKFVSGCLSSKLLEKTVAERTGELRAANQQLTTQAEELQTQNELIEKQRQKLVGLRTSQSHHTKHNYQLLIELIKEEIKYQTDPKAIESLEKIATIASIRAHLSRRIYEEQTKDATYRYDLLTYISKIIYELSSIAAGSNFDELQWSASVENVKLQVKEMSGSERIMNELYHNAEKYLRNLPYAPHIHIAIKKTIRAAGCLLTKTMAAATLKPCCKKVRAHLPTCTACPATLTERCVLPITTALILS